MTPEEQMAKDVAWLEAQAIASEMVAQGTEEYAASEPCEKYPLLRERMIQHRDAARVEAEAAARDAVRYRRILAALTARQDREALHNAAWDLSTWAASINWSPLSTNTISWLEELHERILAVQAFGRPMPADPRPATESMPP